MTRRSQLDPDIINLHFNYCVRKGKKINFSVCFPLLLRIGALPTQFI